MIKKTSLRAILAGTLGMLMFNACKQDKTKIYEANDPVIKNLDTTVKPSDNFFQYANGGWLKRNPIPPAYAEWGIGNVVDEDLRNKVKKINEDALKASAA